MIKKYSMILVVLLNVIFISFLVGCKTTKEYLSGTYKIVSIDQMNSDVTLKNLSRDSLINLSPSYITFGTKKELYGDDEIWHGVDEEDEVVVFYNYISPIDRGLEFWMYDSVYKSRSNHTDKYYISDSKFIFESDEIYFGGCKIEMIINQDIIEVLYYGDIDGEFELIFIVGYQKTTDDYYDFASYEESIKNEW